MGIRKLGPKSNVYQSLDLSLHPDNIKILFEFSSDLNEPSTFAKTMLDMEIEAFLISR
jgi:hypothetical protein